MPLRKLTNASVNVRAS